MAESLPDDALDVLACDFRARPRGAPTVFAVLPVIRELERAADTLTVVFTPDAAELVTAYVEAERLCCADIRWELHTEPLLRLHITAKPGQLDILEQLFTDRELAATS